MEVEEKHSPGLGHVIEGRVRRVTGGSSEDARAENLPKSSPWLVEEIAYVQGGEIICCSQLPLFPLDQASALLLMYVCSFHCNIPQWTHPVESTNWIHSQTSVRPHLQVAGGKLPRNKCVFHLAQPPDFQRGKHVMRIN